MRVAVTGSIATDHLMTFPGRFAEQLLDGNLEQVSLSFLADELEVRRGGVAANIAVGLSRLGQRPLLVAAAGRDFAEYAEWLRAQAVDTGAVRVSTERHTARFVCTTDADQNQIATFYAGAMAEARHIDLAAELVRAGDIALVMVGPDDPAAMLRHTDACRASGTDFAADPSQQLARLGPEEARRLVEGARFLFTNAYESALLAERTGWSRAELLDRVGCWLITQGADGVVIARAGEPDVAVPAVAPERIADPTGAGDGFRAGFLSGTARGLPLAHAARLGCAVAAVVLETVGTQEYKLSAADLWMRIESAYGPATAAAIINDLELP
ncbi:carbohydrate kinase family protein [Streptomyces sp. 3MP-14]|uniref:Carbohydrate kinase family protein n=1 Tax=Streptomyces mimosae TaxID=2586635 RepID=A0A5N6AQH7_9ACTN|nr:MULTISPECIES: carbohydrate kinase family protein [Streptomyces]KAB8169888.1 carbohydrate kinase family protein [Streptomyces mimosae]KAB8178636.1 carbohydrate kinase family protein [Streptomyces sp. 3MP-14]